MKEITLKHPMHTTFHKRPLPQDDVDNTRFYRWHIDAALYRYQPPKVTTLLAIQVSIVVAMVVVAPREGEEMGCIEKEEGPQLDEYEI